MSLHSKAAVPPDGGQPVASAQGEWLDALYRQFLLDPQRVGADWRSYFAALPAESGVAAAMSFDRRQVAVLQLINAYRGSSHRVKL